MASTEPHPREPEWTIQDRLRKARDHGGFKSQRELADAIGTSEATVTRYEAGTTERMKPLVLRQWALACGVPFEWLTGEGSPTTQQVDTPPDLHEHPLGKAA